MYLPDVYFWNKPIKTLYSNTLVCCLTLIKDKKCGTNLILEILYFTGKHYLLQKYTKFSHRIGLFGHQNMVCIKRNLSRLTSHSAKWLFFIEILGPNVNIAYHVVQIKYWKSCISQMVAAVHFHPIRQRL